MPNENECLANAMFLAAEGYSVMTYHHLFPSSSGDCADDDEDE